MEPYNKDMTLDNYTKTVTVMKYTTLKWKHEKNRKRTTYIEDGTIKQRYDFRLLHQKS